MIVEWEGLSFGAPRVKREVLDYLETERGSASDMILAETLLDELVSNIARCAPRKATLEVVWADDGTALLELRNLESTIEPKGVAPTEGWGLMIMSGLNEALDVRPSHDGSGECLTVLLPVVRKGTNEA